MLIPDDRLVQGQHEQAPPQGATDGGEAGCSDLLEDRHDEPQRLPLAALSFGKGEALLQIPAELGVEAALFLRHCEGLGMDPATGEEWGAVWPTGIGLGSPEHHRVQAVPVLDHVVRTVEQRRIHELDEHPKAKVISLVWGRRQQKQIPRVAFQRFCQLEVLGLPHLAAGAIGG